MKEEPLDHLVEEIIGKIGDGPNSHQEALSKIFGRDHDPEALKEIILSINESFAVVRIIVEYLRFDLEATRRERDQFRMMLEDKDD